MNSGLVSRTCVLFPVTIALASLAAAQVQTVKLNDPLARDFVGEVEDIQISPDGVWAVYRANPDVLTQVGIFSVPTKGGEPILLADDVPSFVRLHISPDSRFVLYSHEDLYLVPIDGSREPAVIAEGTGRDFVHTPDGLEIVFESGGGIYRMSAQGSEPILVAATGSANEDFAISPDGQWVLFRGSTNGLIELYAAALDGSTGPIQVNEEPVPNGDVIWFTIAPDSQHVVYVADQDTDRVLELYGTRIDGSLLPEKLTGPLTQQQAMSPWGAWISPDSTRAVYQADQDTNDVVELFSAPIEGGAPAVRLNDELSIFGDVITSRGTPYGVVYLADQSLDGRFELFHVGASRTGPPRKLNQTLPPGSTVGAFDVTPDGRVVYTVGTPGSTSDLYSVPILGGSAPIPLTALAGGERVLDFQVTGDSQRVVFRTQNGHQLFSVRTDGVGAPLRLDDGGDVQIHYFLDPFGERVLYRANRDVAEVYELFGVPTDGSEPPVKLNRPMDDGLVIGDVNWSEFGADGTWALFVVQLADGSTDFPPEELYSVRLQPLSPPNLLYSGYVSGASVSPDETRVVFTTESPGGEGSPSLHSVPIDGGAEAVQLSTGNVNFGVGDYVFTPDGGALLFAQDGGQGGLFRVPVDGSAPAVELTGWTGFIDQPYLFEVDASGSFLVFLAEELVPDEFELFRLDTDGATPPLPLNDLVNPRGSRRYGFQLSEDGSRVVYAVDGVTDELFELFSASTAGAGTPTKLSGTLAPGSDVDAFAVVPGTDRVVFNVRDSAFKRQLFSASILGGADPVRLHPVPTPGGDVGQFRLGSNGMVAFTADLTTDNRVDLFVVPSDGSADPIRLDSNPLAQGDVFQFEFSPDGQRVVYRADHVQDEVFDVFSATIDGRGPIQLSGAHVPGGDVGIFQITPDSQRVVFDADLARDEVFELYAAPIDRIKGARRISGPLSNDGDVLDFRRIAPDGQHAMYIADQDEDDVFELYLTPTDPPRRATRANGTTRVRPGGGVVR